MSQGRGQKILRIGIIQDGKIVEERLLRRQEPVTIGQSPRNTFVLPSGGLPKSFRLFDLKGTTYHLNFRAGMNGKLSIDDSVLDFRALRDQKLARKKGDKYTVRLSRNCRGKIVFGDVTILFQFVSPPPPPAKLQLPASMRGGWVQHMDWPFVISLLGSFVVQVFSLTFIVTRDYPEEPRGIEALPDRFVSALFKNEEPPPKPKPTNDEKKDEDEDKKKDPDKKVDKSEAKVRAAKEETPEASARRKAKELRRMQKDVANKTILKFIGTDGGEGPGGFLNTLKDGATDVAISEAFDGTSGLVVANRDGVSRDRRIGSTTGTVAGIDENALRTKGGAVSSGKKGTELSVKGRVKVKAPSEAFGTGSLDPSAIGKVVRRRVKAIKTCYEKQLKRNPNLSGKVKVQFTILGSGRVGEVRALENTMGETAVAQCVVSRVKRWRFPKPDGGSVTVAFPFVFSPSSG
jgi:TonB family protein